MINTKINQFNYAQTYIFGLSLAYFASKKRRILLLVTKSRLDGALSGRLTYEFFLYVLLNKLFYRFAKPLVAEEYALCGLLQMDLADLALLEFYDILIEICLCL